MKNIKVMEFHQGQAIAVNTYVSIMANACEVVLSHTDEPSKKDSFFWDFASLVQDKTMDKVALANEMIKEVSMKNGEYLKGDFMDLEFPASQYLWFINIHNKAVESAHLMMSFNSTDLTIIQ